MRRDGIDPELLDYLDGRLSLEERAELEARLAREPEVARRLESYRKLGRLLREGPADLPPGFYARARARFEASLRKPAPLWRRPLSWEVAGLATAALLVAAVLVPSYLRQAGRTPPESEPKVERQEPRDLATETIPADEPERKEAAKKIEVAGDATREEGVKDRSAASAPSPPVFQKQEATPETPIGGYLEEKDARSPDRATATVPVQSARPAVAGREDAGLALEGRLYQEGKPVPDAVSLPEGALAPGAVLVIGRDDLDTWNALLEGPAGPSLAALRLDLSASRIVLIGPRSGPLDCSSLSLEREEGRVLLRLFPPVRGSPSATGGCAVRVPGGTEPIVVADPFERTDDGP